MKRMTIAKKKNEKETENNFSNLTTEVNNHLPHSYKDPLEYHSGYFPSSHFISHVLLSEIPTVVKSLKNKKSSLIEIPVHLQQVSKPKHLPKFMYSKFRYIIKKMGTESLTVSRDFFYPSSL